MLEFLLHGRFFFQARFQSSSILSSTRSAQLSRQNRNVSPSALVLNQNLLEILKLVLADLWVRGQDLLCGGTELQVAEDLSCEWVHDWGRLLRYG